MRTLRWMVLALALAAFFGAPRCGHADAVAQAPQQSPTLEPAPAPPPTESATPPPSTGIFGLSATQVWILAGLCGVFIATAILMRWWLSEPATPEEAEAEAPPVPNPQDLPP